MYLADYVQPTYENTRQDSFNTLKVNQIESFLSWVEAKVLKDKWSFDAAVGYAMRNSLFARNEMVCTKTLYNYLHQGLLRVKAMDLPGIIRQPQKKRHTREHKRKLGKSIDLRDKSIDSRKEFGHWELDTVRGIKIETTRYWFLILQANVGLMSDIRGYYFERYAY